LPTLTDSPYYDNGLIQLYQADARELPLEDGTVHCCVTSPPYFGLRVYQTDDDRVLGLESSIDEYIANMVNVFREVWRVLRDDGVCWINMGDSYAGSGKGQNADGGHAAKHGEKQHTSKGTLTGGLPANSNHRLEGDRYDNGMVGGNLLGVPWCLALALQADGWILRDAIIWAKKSSMPESLAGWRWERCRVKVKNGEFYRRGLEGVNNNFGFGRRADQPDLAQWADCPGCAKCEANDGLVLRKGSWRCTSSYELIFMLVKSMNYWADGEAVKTAYSRLWDRNNGGSIANDTPWMTKAQGGKHGGDYPLPGTGANRRNVWKDLKPEPYGDMTCPGCGRSFKPKIYQRFPKFEGHPICPRCEEPLQSHYATFPPDLPRLCIQASTSEMGCCPVCGSQVTRVVESHTSTSKQTGNNWQEGRGLAGHHGPSRPGGFSDMADKTTGWRPSCAHQEAIERPVPCHVLDCFSGTGTTALAAMRLNRRCVGTDLSQEYIKQAEARLCKETLPLPLAAP